MTFELLDKLENSTDPMLGYKIFHDIVSANSKVDDSNQSIMDQAQLNLLKSDEIKLFLIDEKMKFLFQNTIPPTISSEIKMPFDCIFLSCILPVKTQFFMCGAIIIYEKPFTEQKLQDQEILDQNKKLMMNPHLGISCVMYDTAIGKSFSMDFYIDLLNGNCNERNPSHQNPGNNKKSMNLKKSIRDFIINALLFLNEPRVVTYIVTPNHKRRERKGLIPMPSRLVTKITPELREYINIAYQSHSKLGYSFDVRGHWRVLKHPRYKDNVGKKIWIPPHLKGQGLKAPQVFKICAK